MARRVVVLALGLGASARAQGDAPAALDELIGRYFHEGSDNGRNQLLDRIEKAADGSINRVAEAVRKVQLWAPIPETDRVVLSTTSAGQVSAIYHGFKNPDQPEARGMVLCLPASEGMEEANLAINRAVMALGPTLYDHSFIVALDKPIAGTFHQHPAAGDDFRQIIRELRRRLRLDTDRVFLFGYGQGGEAAWNAAISHPHLFAGVVAVASHPRLPYPEQLAPLLLPNLRKLPVLSIWESDAGDSPDDEVLATAVFNRAIARFAENNRLPIRGLAATFRPTGSVDRPNDLPSYVETERAVLAFAEHRRSPAGQSATHWFRYLAQGDLGWLRAAKLHGDVWTEDQLSIVPTAQADRDTFITDFFKQKLFHVSGEVAGQTITIQTKGIAKLDVLFFDGMMDYGKPVTVLCNGRKRFEGLIKSAIATLLENAYDEWEFQRLVFSTMTFSIRPDGAGD